MILRKKCCCLSEDFRNDRGFSSMGVANFWCTCFANTVFEQSPSQTHFPRIIRQYFMIKNFLILVQFLALKIRRFYFVKLAFKTQASLGRHVKRCTQKNSILDARTLWFDQEKSPGFKLSIVLYDQLIELVPSKSRPLANSFTAWKSSSIFYPEQFFIHVLPIAYFLPSLLRYLFVCYLSDLMHLYENFRSRRIPETCRNNVINFMLKCYLFFSNY